MHLWGQGHVGMAWGNRHRAWGQPWMACGGWDTDGHSCQHGQMACRGQEAYTMGRLNIEVRWYVEGGCMERWG